METQEITHNGAKQDVVGQFQKLAEGLNNWPAELFADSEVVIVYGFRNRLNESDDVIVLEPGEDPTAKLRLIRDDGGIPVGVFFAGFELYKLVGAMNFFEQEKERQWEEERMRHDAEVLLEKLALEVGIDEPHAKVLAAKFFADKPRIIRALCEDDRALCEADIPF